jgi:hypothetical protein
LKPNMGSSVSPSLKLTRALVAAALALAPGISLTCAAQDTQAPPITYPVEGVILNSVTRQPIPRVLVDGASDATLTDGEGHFELNLPAGPSQISLRRPGYIADNSQSAHAAIVAANMPSLAFYITPTATITGHVTLSTGEDASGISFVAYRRSFVNGRLRWSQQGNANTNSQGIFRMEDINAPATYVLCSIPSHDRIPGAPTSLTSYGFPSVCYPEAFSTTADIPSANLLNLTAGQQADVNITLSREHFYRVTIAVSNHPAVQGVYVQIHEASGRALDYYSHWNPQQGAAEVSLPNGQYFAEVRSSGENSSYGRVDFKVANAPVSGLNAALIPLRPIPVRIDREFSATAGNQLIPGKEGLNPGLNLNLVNVDSLTGDMGGLQPAKGASDSNLFVIQNIPPGSYWVQTTAFEGYIASIISGGVDLTRQPLVIGPGDTTSPIDITLRNDGGQISGLVSLPQATSAANPGETTIVYVYAIPQFPTTSPATISQQQLASSFTIGNLTPGAYKVAACDQAHDPTDLPALAPCIAKAQNVIIQANGTENLQLELVQINAAANSSSPDTEQ